VAPVGNGYGGGCGDGGIHCVGGVSSFRSFGRVTYAIAEKTGGVTVAHVGGMVNLVAGNDWYRSLFQERTFGLVVSSRSLSRLCC